MLIRHPCNPNKSQDDTYGKNVRVCKPTDKKDTFRCTVCEKTLNKPNGRKK